LSEAVARCEISTDYFDVAIFENVADVPALRVLHTLSLYVARNAIRAAYPLFLRVEAVEIAGRENFSPRRCVSRQAATGRGNHTFPF
jgi:hypothetical protein